MSIESNVWFRAFDRTSTKRPTLLCLPHAGGSSGFFRSLSEHLADSKEIVAVQYPGRQDRLREEPLKRIPELAATIASEAREAMEGSIQVLGHSMGALVGFELARMLEEDKTLRVEHLTITNMRAPSIPARPPYFHTLADPDFFGAVAGLGATDPALFDDAEMARHIQGTLRVDFSAVEVYRAIGCPKVTCGVTAVVGLQDQLFTAAEVGAWRRHTTGKFRLRMYDVDHFGIYDAIPSLAALLLEVP